MTTHDVAELVGLMVTVAMLLITVITLWLTRVKDARNDGSAAGVAAAEMRAAVNLLAEMRADVKMIPVLVVRLGQLEEALGHHVRTDHRELRARIDSIHDGDQ